MTGRFRFVSSLPQRERELVVDVPETAVGFRRRAGERQRPAECLDRLGCAGKREMGAAQKVIGLRRRWVGGDGDRDMGERFGGAPRFDQRRAEPQVRQHVSR